MTKKLQKNNKKVASEVNKILTKKQKTKPNQKSNENKKEFENKYKEIVASLEKKLKIEQKIKSKPKINESKKEKKPKHQPILNSKIVGLLILISGFIFIINPISLNLASISNKILTYPDALNIKIGIGLIIIGLFSIILIYEKTTTNIISSKKKSNNKKIKLLTSEKLTLTLSIWIILLLFITYNASSEVFFILIFIGTLVTKELSDEFTTQNFKKRVNFFIAIFLIIFIGIISQKIINIL